RPTPQPSSSSILSKPPPPTRPCACQGGGAGIYRALEVWGRGKRKQSCSRKRLSLRASGLGAGRARLPSSGMPIAICVGGLVRPNYTTSLVEVGRRAMEENGVLGSV